MPHNPGVLLYSNKSTTHFYGKNLPLISGYLRREFDRLDAKPKHHAKEARRVYESVLHDIPEFSVDSRVIEEIDGAKSALSLPSNGEREKRADARLQPR